MRVYVGQIYIQPGINYPFSHIFQKWIGEELTKLIKPSEIFLKNIARISTLLLTKVPNLK